LARPGGNVTGQSIQSIDLVGKRLALLRQIVPRLGRLAIMFDAGFSETVAEADLVKATAHTLGLEVAPLEIRRSEDVAPAFEMLKSQIDAVYVVGDALVSANRSRITTFALSNRLPTIFNTRADVQAGALMSYGPNFPALFRRTAEYVDKILRGAKPGDLPVEQPTKFDLVINLTTARALGLTIPPTLLAIADEVID
jgi:putative ABC transport system substrate-binding protein